MQVGAGSDAGAQAVRVAALMQVLRASQEQPVELVEKLLRVDVRNSVQAQRLELAGQIIDAYA